MSAVHRPYGACSETRVCWQCGGEFVARQRDEVFCAARCGMLHRYERATGQERRHLARRLGGVVGIAALTATRRAA